jgi:hypothetical protein
MVKIHQMELRKELENLTNIGENCKKTLPFGVKSQKYLI